METPSFLEKFKNFDSSALRVEKYPRYYCDHILSHLNYYVSIYTQIIDLTVEAAQKPVTELTVLDYGAGNGFLGMFAKFYGFKKVWMSDLSADFLSAANQTAGLVNIDIDGFIEGDVEAACLYFERKGCQPDIVLSTDVIEHIYDLDAFFEQLRLLNPGLISAFTTASNPYNARKVRALRKLQYKDEWIGYAGMSKDEREDRGLSGFSFYEQRRTIIKENFRELPDELVSKLALHTRGLRKAEILSSVSEYITRGIDPVAPKDPFWVCDPYTGSWTERVLPLTDYERVYRENGFSFLFCNGFYNHFSGNAVKRAVVRLLNRMISRNKQAGKYLAPYLVFLGRPSKSGYPS